MRAPGWLEIPFVGGPACGSSVSVRIAAGPPADTYAVPIGPSSGEPYPNAKKDGAMSSFTQATYRLTRSNVTGHAVYLYDQLGALE